MRDYLAITRALSDEARVRALVSLADGELCLCQVIELLGLSPSTVSRHLAILHQAQLVERRKDGRWHYYRLAGRGAPAAVREAIRWTLRSVRSEQVIVTDARTLCCVRGKDRAELTGCYSAN